jgi:hypothetical protein
MTDQLTREDLESMSLEEVAEAHREGRLDELLQLGDRHDQLDGTGSPPPPSVDLGARGERLAGEFSSVSVNQVLDGLTAEEITRMHALGLLDRWLS